MSIFAKHHDYIDTDAPKPPPLQTPFASIMQLFKIMAIVGPCAVLGFELFDRTAGLIEKFDGIGSHLSTLDSSVVSLNGAVSSLSATLATQVTTTTTHTAQLNAQSDSLGRIESALQRWGGPGPAHEAYAAPYVPPVPVFSPTRHPCDKPAKPREHC